ncbi:hypothetical protein JCM6882_001234 [Rhodosporidiobolus microsporus]
MRTSCRLCYRALTRSTPLRTPASLSRPSATFSSLDSSAPSPLPSLLSPRPARLPAPSLPAQTRSYAAPARKAKPEQAVVTLPAQAPPNPPEDFEPVEEELKEGEVLDMRLTEAAVKQIHRAQSAASNPDLALRLAVESGGCHGYQYKMQVTGERGEDDYLFESASPSTARLLVDAASLPLVRGATIDYATELIGSSFRVMGNPQSKDAGCGCGVSWELKDLD